jgi:hypothetical protein
VRGFETAPERSPKKNDGTRGTYQLATSQANASTP